MNVIFVNNIDSPTDVMIEGVRKALTAETFREAVGALTAALLGATDIDLDGEEALGRVECVAEVLVTHLRTGRAQNEGGAK